MSTDTDPFGQPYRLPGLDTIGWYIATSHQLLGHDKAAAVLGVDPGDKTACLICAYEQAPDEPGRQVVIRALTRKPENSDRPERSP